MEVYQKEPIDYKRYAALISSLCALYKSDRNIYDEFFSRYLKSPEIGDMAEALEKSFSTYSEDEIEEIIRRIENCRKIFISEGDGPNRNRCLCSVLNNVKSGNGGTLPPIEEWERMYETLGCGVEIS